MKTKEFIEKVEALGYEVHVRGKEMKICDEGSGYGVRDPLFVLVSDLAEVLIPGKVYISSLERIGLLNVVTEYLNTPLADREEEKRCRLRYDVPPLLRKAHAKAAYLSIRRIDGRPDISNSPIEHQGFQKFFTESEIAQMDITGFQKEEVE